jgi:hypothetical protein
MTRTKQGPVGEHEPYPSPAAKHIIILIVNILHSKIDVVRASKILSGKYTMSLACYFFDPNCHAAQVSVTETLLC